MLSGVNLFSINDSYIHLLVRGEEYSIKTQLGYIAKFAALGKALIGE